MSAYTKYKHITVTGFMNDKKRPLQKKTLNKKLLLPSLQYPCHLNHHVGLTEKISTNEFNTHT